MFPILQIGPLAVQTPGLILLLGLWIGLRLSERYAVEKQADPNRYYNLVFIALLSGIIGARLGYIAAYPVIFKDNPASIFSINPGLLDIWSGLATGFIAALIYGKMKNLLFWQTLDLLSPAIAVFLIAMSLANLASGKGYGLPSDVPWAIELWGARRHPTQVYEAVSGYISLWAIWPGKRFGNQPQEGIQFLSLIILLSASRLFIEAYRGDSEMIVVGIRTAQIFYWFVLGISLWLTGRKLNQRSLKPASQADSSHVA